MRSPPLLRSQLNAAPEAFAEQRAVAIHELFHALGFSASSWAYFRNADGTPKTPRDANGQPVFTTYTCPDGVARTVQVPANNTLQVALERGVKVTRIVTPKVVSVARDIFGCDSLTGAELENHPTSAGACFGSHWEMRNFVNEVLPLAHTVPCIVTRTKPHAPPRSLRLSPQGQRCKFHLSSRPCSSTTQVMGPVMAYNPVYSALTLAAMEDSGWYVANYSLAEPLIWGRLQNCSFITSKCVNNGVALATPNPNTFCTSSSTGGCNVDFTATSYCNIVTYGSSLPAPFRYFSNPKVGGALYETDYCPFMEGEEVRLYALPHCCTLLIAWIQEAELRPEGRRYCDRLLERQLWRQVECALATQ